MLFFCAELEVVSARSSGHGQGQSRIVEEKAALERRVQQLTTDLKRTEDARQKDKENSSSASSSSFGYNDVSDITPSFSPSDAVRSLFGDPSLRAQRQQASSSNANARLIALENQITALKDENNRLTQSKNVRLVPSRPHRNAFVLLRS